MTIEQFTIEESKYIYAGIYDNNQDIYAYRGESYPNGLYAKYLPAGEYSLIAPPIARNSWVENLRQEGVNASVTYSGIKFNIATPSEFHLPFFDSDIVFNVITLRKQAILNGHNSKRLIAKAIKTHTNYGEDYNRASFCDAVMDCMITGEELIVDESKSIADPDVKYLRFMQLLQLSHKLDAEQEALNKKKDELKRKSEELMK